MPIAIGLIDPEGRILGHIGKAAYLYRDVIPSHDPAQRDRWRVTDDSGVCIHPSRWPSKRALKGEVDLCGVLGRYRDGDEQLFRVVAVPTLDLRSNIAAVSFIRRIDTPCGAANQQQAILESRLIDTLIQAIATARLGPRV